MNIKIKNLTVSDFPGIDEAKFNEWKALQIKSDLESRIATLLLFTIYCGLSWVIFNFRRWTDLLVFVILMTAAYGFYLARSKRLRQLRKGLKISDRLWAKKKGRAFTG
jgi:hypothetical protein